MATTYLGPNGKVYYNSGTYGSPTWVELSIVNDWSRESKLNEAEANSRASFVDLIAATSMALSWQGTMKNDGSAAWTFVYEAMHKRTAVDFLVLNGPHSTNGVTGHRADCLVLDTSEDGGRNTRLYNSIMLKPTESDNVPKAVKVAGGVPTYATIDGTTLTYA